MIGVPAWSPSVPSGLRDRVATMLGGEPPTDARCLAAAGMAARRLAEVTSSEREGALQLLAVDALVTHALHEAAENPEQFEATCHLALVSLAHSR